MLFKLLGTCTINQQNLRLRLLLQTLERVRAEIADSNVWVQVDETTDSVGRYIANVLVGAMKPDDVCKPHLLVSRELPSTNHATVSRLVNDAMAVLWPNGTEHDRVLLLLSDAAPYMVKAGKALQVFYPNMVHVTCLAHALHRVAETVRTTSKYSNTFISNVRKIFVKAPLRVQVYKEMNPKTPLPPEPVLTRWGTWLAAAFFYADNYEGIKNAVQALCPTDALAIAKAQESLKNPALLGELAYMKCHFGQLVRAITSLEKRDLPMAEALEIISGVEASLSHVVGDIGYQAQAKLSAVLAKNPGYAVVKAINDALRGEAISDAVKLPPALVACFKNAPLTSVEVERSFSSFKAILADNRKRMTPQNLEQLLVAHCN